MGIYDGFGDTPNQIKSEGQQINIAFIRNGDGSATIKWNIPPPVAGCSQEDQAYDGIIITVSDKPANYIASSPIDGTYYTGDPTFNADLHVGDKLDGARIVGAFYHDKTTKTLIVQDVEPKTPYYVSAYAVDGVARYHREGVHAYSISTGSEEYNPNSDTPAYQNIGIDLNPINNGTLTGLLSGSDYSLNVVINNTTYTLLVEGQDALTYPDLVDAMNSEFVRLTDAVRVNLDSTLTYYYNTDTNVLYRWNYDTYVEVPVIVEANDPAIPLLGTYWYNGTDLYVYESGGWVEVPLFTLSFDPASPTCGTVWYDGTDTWIWGDTHWVKLTTYSQTTNPLLPPVMTCDDYWYDENEFILKKWFIDIAGWGEIDAIYSVIDPNTIDTNDFWYDSSNEKMFVMNAGVWNELVNVEYLERNSSGDLDTPIANQYWYIPSEQLFYRRNGGNTAWNEVDFTLAISDPTVRTGSDVWWKPGSPDELYTWDELNSVWVEAGSFNDGTYDPSGPPTLSENSIWLNPETAHMQMLITPSCSYTDVEYIEFPTDPTELVYGYGWYDLEGNFGISDGVGGWNIITPIISEIDPYNVIVDTFWYDLSNELLKQWSGAIWEEVLTRDTMSYPDVGEMVLNDVDNKLYSWSGATWVLADAIAVVTLINPNTSTMENYFNFATTAIGCSQSINVLAEADTILSKLSSSVVYYDPVDGSSRLEKGPSWSTLGVGDDGSPDERRALHTIIRGRLGFPTQRVELTSDQIDEAINSALQLIRKYSGYGYHREYFFLNLKPNQQKYRLTDRCAGFNKVTGVNYVYRLRSGFLNGNLSRGGYDIYGYAALQHLYKTGTFDMLSYHLVSSYIEDMQIMFADHITYDWNETYRELRLYHAIYDKERVLLDTYIERTEQDLFVNRETREWIKRWAIAECKVVLSQVRGKFQTLPGPNGSTTLNSQELITQGETEKTQLLEELYDPAMQNLEEAGGGAHFIFG